MEIWAFQVSEWPARPWWDELFSVKADAGPEPATIGLSTRDRETATTRVRLTENSQQSCRYVVMLFPLFGGRQRPGPVILRTQSEITETTIPRPRFAESSRIITRIRIALCLARKLLC